MKSVSSNIEVLFVIHAESQSNALWQLWQEIGVVSWIFDPSITEKGYQQAIELKNILLGKVLQKGGDPDMRYFAPDLIVSSPLKRCLLTANIVFGEIGGDSPQFFSKKFCQKQGAMPQWIVHPLVTEKLTEAADIGSLKRDLIDEFPSWDWSLVSDDFWWYIPAELKCPFHSLIDHQSLFKANPWSESNHDLDLRISEFLNWLRNQPANKVVVFTHGSYISRLVGGPCDLSREGNCKVNNCESILKTYSRLEDMTPATHITGISKSQYD